MTSWVMVIYQTYSGIDTFQMRSDNVDHVVRQVYIDEAKRHNADDTNLELWHPSFVEIHHVFASDSEAISQAWYYKPPIPVETIDEEACLKLAKTLTCPSCGVQPAAPVEPYFDGDEFSHFYCTYCGDTVKHRWNRI